jgi:polar amino acid transport system permease protein
MEFDVGFAWDILPDLLRGAIVTAQATFGGFLVALVLGLVLAISRRSRHRWLVGIAGSFVEFVRNSPLLVQLYFIFYGLPFFGVVLSAMITGILGLGLYYSAYIAEVYRAGIEAVPPSQWEAARSLDLSPSHTWRRIILPQAVPPMLPILGNYLISMFKDTPLLATITIPEMFNAAEQVAGTTYRYNEPYTLLALIFLTLSYPSSLVFRRLESRATNV